MSASSGTPAHARLTAMDTVFLRRRPTGEQDSLNKSFDCFPTSLAVHEEWRKLLVSHVVSGVQVHDARLAAAMRVHGVKRILTFNDRDFARHPDIEAIHPRAVPKN